MTGHHLVLGELQDFITGETLPDTHDERYRQRIAKYLVKKKAYSPTDIRPRQWLPIKAGKHRARTCIDFLVRIDQKICMLVQYGPGSLVTRHRVAIAFSRLAAPYQIPVVVVTNGESADILNGATALKIAAGLENIPDKSYWQNIIPFFDTSPITPENAEMAGRIIYAYVIDDSCPCDDTICRLT